MSVIRKEERWKYINMNPAPPTFRGMIKIHKADAPIRPLINWRNAPAYELAKILTKKTENIYTPPLHIQCGKFHTSIEDLSKITYNPDIQFVSFDITNIYSNVPTGDLLHIIDHICDRQLIDKEVKNDLKNMAKIVLEQNYFQFENNFYSQEIGLAMGSPTSSIFSEIYLQYKECTDIFDTLVHNNIMGYFRYVDDILIVYDKTLTNIYEMLNTFNRIMSTMKFTIEKENTINFLDITVKKEKNKLNF
jgi:hypothetical protein